MIIQWEEKDKREAVSSISNALEIAKDAALAVATDQLYFSIESLARQELKTTYIPFIMGLSVIKQDDEISFELDEMAQQIETGFKARDLRSMLYGPSAKINEDGDRYIDIPFRAATPSANMRGANFASQMEKHSYEAVKLLGSLQAGDLDATRGINQMTGYQHKNHIYENLQKLNDPKSGNSIYMSFRRLSENSDPSSFIVKPVSGHYIVKRAIEQFDVGKVINILNS